MVYAVEEVSPVVMSEEEEAVLEVEDEVLALDPKVVLLHLLAKFLTVSHQDPLEVSEVVAEEWAEVDLCGTQKEAVVEEEDLEELQEEVEIVVVEVVSSLAVEVAHQEVLLVAAAACCPAVHQVLESLEKDL